MGNMKTVFVIMPFSETETCTEDQWTDIYDNVFRAAIEDCGYSCERATPETGSLIRSIIEKLRNSAIVLADITDRNPNVLYELGVRHSLSKRTIIVSQRVDDIPSDLRGYWSIIYGIRPAEVKKLKADIKNLLSKIEKNPDRSDSPVSDYLDQEHLNVSKQTQIDNIKKLGALCTELTENLALLTDLSNNSLSFSNVAGLLSDDSLRLLLTTLYTNIQPKLLSEAYGLRYALRGIMQGARDEALLDETIARLQYFLVEIYEIRRKLASSQYNEPETISVMIWGRQTSEQIISEAGLVMNGRVLEHLPPFLNIDKNVVWIDDHLKRSLHKALSNLRENKGENGLGGRFKKGPE